MTKLGKNRRASSFAATEGYRVLRSDGNVFTRLHSKILRFEADLVRFRFRSVYIPIQMRSNIVQQNIWAMVSNQNVGFI